MVWDPRCACKFSRSRLRARFVLLPAVDITITNVNIITLCFHIGLYKKSLNLRSNWYSSVVSLGVVLVALFSLDQDWKSGTRPN